MALGSYFFAGLGYTGFAQIILVGATLAILSILSDMMVLDRLGHIGSFIADTLVATLVIRFSQFYLPGSVATWGAAFGTGLLLGLSEIFLHRWIQESRRRGVRENRP